MTYLKLFIITLVILDNCQAKVISTSGNQKPSLLASYAVRKANEMGITQSELIKGLETLKNKDKSRSSRKLLFFDSDASNFEFQKRRDSNAQEMTNEIENNLNKLVLDAETNNNGAEDESEMDKISDLYLRTRDYIDTVKNDLKDTIDNLQHDLDVQLIEHQNAVQNENK